jgi:hypothetical protein
LLRCWMEPIFVCFTHDAILNNVLRNVKNYFKGTPYIPPLKQGVLRRVI